MTIKTKTNTIFETLKTKYTSLTFENLRTKMYNPVSQTKPSEKTVVPQTTTTTPSSSKVYPYTQELRDQLQSYTFYQGALIDLNISSNVKEHPKVLENKIQRLHQLEEEVTHDTHLSEKNKRELLTIITDYLKENNKSFVKNTCDSFIETKKYYYEGMLSLLDNIDLSQNTSLIPKIHEIRIQLGKERDLPVDVKEKLDAFLKSPNLQEIPELSITNKGKAAHIDPSTNELMVLRTNYAKLNEAYHHLIELLREKEITQEFNAIHLADVLKLKKENEILLQKNKELQDVENNQPLVQKNAVFLMESEKLRDKINALDNITRNLELRKEHLLKENEDLYLHILNLNQRAQKLQQLLDEKLTPVIPILHLTTRQKETIVPMLLDITKQQEEFHITLENLNRNIANVTLLQQSHNNSLNEQHVLVAKVNASFAHYDTLTNTSWDLARAPKHIAEKAEALKEFITLCDQLTSNVKTITENLKIFEEYTIELAHNSNVTCTKSTEIIHKTLQIFEKLTNQPFNNTEQLYDYISKNKAGLIKPSETVNNVQLQAVAPISRYRVNNLSKQVNENIPSSSNTTIIESPTTDID